MKSILIVIYAHYVKLIIEGKKTVEVRKNKNLANAIKKLIAEQGGCWIYIYVAKGKPYLYNLHHNNEFYLDNLLNVKNQKLNGKVVARFWCDKVEEFIYSYSGDIYVTDLTGSNGEFDILIKSGLYRQQLYEYTKFKPFYAIHISKLEVFDKPKCLHEFHIFRKIKKPCLANEIRQVSAPYIWVESEK